MKTGCQAGAGKRNIALIACDLDGTLIDSGGMSERTKAALMRAHENGCNLVLSTGRAQQLIPPKIRSFPFSYIITSNGARVIDAGTGEVLFLAPINKELAMSLLGCVDRKRALINGFIDGRALVNFRWLRMEMKDRKVPAKRGMLERVHMLRHMRFVKSIQSVLAKKSVTIEKFSCVFDDAAYCKAILEEFLQLGSIEAVTTTGYDIEITAKGTSKGSALIKLCNRLGIPKEQVIAFGDSGNDFSMLAAAGCFIATGNASEEIKAAAHRVTLSADNDGVAVVLEELFGV